MKFQKLITIFILILIIFVQCQTKKQQDKKPKILTGWLTENDLFKEFPSYKQEKDFYQPDKNIIAELNKLTENYHVIVFLGTYCSDCKEEVPRFLKTIDLLENLEISYKLFGLDRTKSDTSGMREKYNLEFIPTFIVYHNNVEIGRIVERPMVSIENDLLEICTSV